MQRREFVKWVPAAGLAGYSLTVNGEAEQKLNFTNQSPNAREYWVNTLTRIANPVLNNLYNHTLHSNMPVECKPGNEKSRKSVSHLEAFGRLLSGMAPWLELGADASFEGTYRKKYLDMMPTIIHNVVNPDSPDFMNFKEGGQPLVDAAFMAHGFLRGYEKIWMPLDNTTKDLVINALKQTRKIKPGYSNWLLFSALIEAFMLKSGNEWDPMRVDYALKKHMEWYKGDGIYGDGPDFHWDYYNSFVIQPMLLDIVRILVDHGLEKEDFYQTILGRAKRFAVIQERMISPEGTFPAIGRSLAYRFGVFQLLSQISLIEQLPDELSPSQVRCGLTAVIRKMTEANGTFDQQGWLTIGFCGHQPSIGESYISTGSLYLCTTGLIALGLPSNNKFWLLPDESWTAKKIWSGIDVPNDHAS